MAKTAVTKKAKEETQSMDNSYVERQKNINSLISAINKKAGKTIIGKADDPEIIEQLTVKTIPTPSLKLNEALGGGWPIGHFSIVTGSPDSGKTFMLLETIGHNMKMNPNFTVLWIESEGSLNNEPIEMFGIERTRFVYYEVGPEGGEVAMNYAISFAKQGIDLIVINSLKCLTPSKEFKDSIEDANVALQARMNAKFMRVVLPTIKCNKSTLIAVQHKSTDIGSYMGGKKIVGGEAILYSSYLTIDNARININSSNPLYSMKDKYMQFRTKVLKNHMCTTVNPFVQAEYTVKIGSGTDVVGEIIEEAERQEIIVKKGAWIREYDEDGAERILDDGTKCAWNGTAKFLEFLDANPDYVEYLKNKIKDNISVNDLSEEEISILQEQSAIENETIVNLEKELAKTASEENDIKQ